MRVSRFLAVIAVVWATAATAVATVPATGVALGPEFPASAAVEVSQDERYAYVVTHEDVRIYDLFAREMDPLVASFPLDAVANAGRVVGGYVITDVAVIDVADPENPTAAPIAPAFRNSLWGRSLGMVGTTLYRGGDPSRDEPAVEAWDLADPSSPRRTGVFFAGEAPEFLLCDGAVMIRRAGDRLELRDASDPAQSLPLLGWLELGDVEFDPRWATMDQGVLYLLADGLVAVDVSDPTSPALLARFDQDRQAVTPPVVDQGRLYASYEGDAWGGRVDVFDVSDPAAPELLTTNIAPAVGRTHRMLAAANGAVLAATPQRVVLESYADPSRPDEVFCDELASGLLLGVHGTKVYLSMHEGRILVADLEDPGRSPSVFELGLMLERIFLSGDMLVGSDGWRTTFFDVGGGAAPARIVDTVGFDGRNLVDTPLGPISFEGWNELKGWDFGDPMSPGEAWRLEIPSGRPLDLAVCDDHFYVEHGGGWSCFRIEDGAPGALLDQRTYGVSARIEAASVVGDEDVVYLAAGDRGLEVWRTVDGMSDPAPVTVLADVDARDVRRDGSTLYVIHGARGLMVFDLSTPYDPILAAAFELEGPGLDDVGARGFAVLDRDLVLGGNGEGPALLFRGLLSTSVANEPTEPQDDAVPSALVLDSASPNPFNPATVLGWELPAPADVRLTVHDLRGREVRRLVDGARAAGFHRTTWDGRDANGRAQPSGIYVARLVAADGVRSVRMTLAR